VAMRRRLAHEIGAEIWNRLDHAAKSGRRFVRTEGRYVLTNDEDEEGG